MQTMKQFFDCQVVRNTFGSIEDQTDNEAREIWIFFDVWEKEATILQNFFIIFNQSFPRFWIPIYTTFITYQELTQSDRFDLSNHFLNFFASLIFRFQIY